MNEVEISSSSPMNEQVQVRFVMVKGVKYFRQEDIVAYFLEVAATEETDVRNRLEECADAFRK